MSNNSGKKDDTKIRCVNIIKHKGVQQMSWRCAKYSTCTLKCPTILENHVEKEKIYINIQQICISIYIYIYEYSLTAYYNMYKWWI